MPEISQFLKTSIEVTDPILPYFYENDSLLNEGFLVLVDPDRLKCWPSQANAVNNDVVKNLVPGGIDSTVVAPVSATFERKGFNFQARTNTNYMRIATAEELDVAAMGSPDMAFIVWLTRDADYATDSYQLLMGAGTSSSVAANFFFYIRLQTNGQSVQFGVSNGTLIKSINLSTAQAAAFNGALLGTTVQLVCAIEGGKLKIFMNGAQDAVPVDAPAKPYSVPSGGIWRMHSGFSAPSFKGVIKRYGIAKLGFGVTAEQIATEDWNINNQRQS